MRIKLLLILLLVLPYTCPAQNVKLNALSEAERNKYLKAVAKETIIKHGPGYYREYKEPEIEKGKIDKREESKDVGRKYYIVTYYYDPTIERLERGYAASIMIDTNTGKAFRASFGNGIGFMDMDKYGTSWQSVLFISINKVDQHVRL